jgi:hypothetical protein
MEFSEKELKLIAAAKRKSSDALVKRVLILIAISVGMGLMIAGKISPDCFAYVTVAAVFLAVAMPQLGGEPKYEDLVKLLDSKLKSKT